MNTYELNCNSPKISQQSQQVNIFLKRKVGLFRKETVGHAFLKITTGETEKIILDDFRLSTGADEWGFGYGKMIISFAKTMILKFYGEQEHTITVFPSSVVDGQTIEELYLKYLGIGFIFRDSEYSKDNPPSVLNKEMYITFKRHTPGINN